MPVIIIAAVLTGLGIYLLGLNLLRVPTKKSQKAFDATVERQSTKPKRIDRWMDSLRQWIAGHLKINPYRRMELEEDLFAAEMNITPEQYMAKSIVKVGGLGLLAIVCFFMISPLFGGIVAATTVVLYVRDQKEMPSRIRARREAIEKELPRLVSTVQKTLLHSRNVLRTLEEYIPNAGPELRRELVITVADMKSGSYETAISRLEARVGSDLMSEVCRGLQSIIRGNDTTAYWETLSVRLRDNQKQLLRRQALKAPNKVKRLNFTLLLCILLLYGTVIVTEIADMIGVLFG